MEFHHIFYVLTLRNLTVDTFFVNQKELKNYYQELMQVVEKRYDEVKIILESYFR